MMTRRANRYAAFRGSERLPNQRSQSLDNPCAFVCYPGLMEERVINLESTFAYQDERIRKLENVVSQQQLELHELRQALELLNKQLQASSQTPTRNAANEPPPPHY